MDGPKPKLAGRVKDSWERKITAVLVGAVALFVVLYVPAEIVAPLGDRLGEWGRWLVKLGAALPLLVVVRWLIFAQDHLATGSSAASRFFRDLYPSTWASKTKGLPQSEADRLWTEYFDTWEQAGHPRHREYEAALRRSYSLRLIYYLKRILLVFVLLAGAATALDPSLLEPKAAVIAAAFLVLVLLHASNRFKKVGDDYEASGAYFKYKEMSGMLRGWFEKDVLSKSTAA